MEELTYVRVLAALLLMLQVNLVIIGTNQSLKVLEVDLEEPHY